MVLLLTASALVLAIVLALLRWFDFAETPLPGIKLSPSAGSAGWTFALEDGTALVPGPDGALDVPEGAWYAGAVRWAAGAGIAGGYGNGLFGSNDFIIRAQVAVMLMRFCQQYIDP